MRGKLRTRGSLCVAALLLMGAQGCLPEGDVTASAESETDASVPELDDKANAAELNALSTDELVRRVSVLPNETVVVFDFDDTLLDHVEGQESRWATFSKSAVTLLKQRSVNIAVCSKNTNTTQALNRKLRELDSTVFNDAFFRSPAFQVDTGTEKWDDIQQIMAYYGVKRQDHVVFYDDTARNIESVSAASDVIAVPVQANGLDQSEFRSGMMQLLQIAPAGSNGSGTTSCNGQCSPSCPCQAGQGDCDSNADCVSGLVCPPDGAGSELCTKPTSGGTTSCNGQCSSICPCQAGQGDCDSNADCASGLVCPPDGEGSELCMKPTSGGSTGGTTSGSGNLRVRVGTRWVSVGCASGTPKADGSSDKWTIVDRKLRNQKGVYLHCSEGWTSERACQCSSSGGEAYHAITQADFGATNTTRKYGNALLDSLTARGPLYIFPNNGHEFCLAVGSNNVIWNKDGGDDGNHAESTHSGKCNQWCMGSGCP